MPFDNVSGRDGAETMDDATRRAIETANDLDLELYYAVKNDPEKYHGITA